MAIPTLTAKRILGDNNPQRREEIAQILQDSPSLKSYPALMLAQAYQLARQNVASETGLPIATFPDNCPFAIAPILNEAFLPNEVASS